MKEQLDQAGWIEINILNHKFGQLSLQNWNSFAKNTTNTEMYQIEFMYQAIWVDKKFQAKIQQKL